MSITNEPALSEEDIELAGLYFYNVSMQQQEIIGTPMNKAGRLYMQSKLHGDAAIHISDDFIADAQKFFAEIWTEEPNPKQSLLYALRTSVFLRPIWK